MMTEFFSLPLHVSCDMLGSWLDLKSVVSLDSAVCNHSARGQLVHFLSSKGLVHQNPVHLRGVKMLHWLFLRSFRVADVHFNVETVHSSLLIRYFASFGDALRGVHFFDQCNNAEIMYLIACFCKNITVLRCINVSIPWAFNALLLNNPNIKEIWVRSTTCKLDDMMANLSLHKLQLLSVKDMDCPVGFPWSESTHSTSLQRVEFVELDSYVDDMKAMMQNCPKLRSFSCQKIQIEDDNMTSYLSSNPEIINLDISNNSVVTDKAILFIAQNLHSLRTLNIQNCSKLTILSLKYIAEYCTMLQVLYIDIRGANKATEQVVNMLSTRCNSLAYLNINSDFILCTTTCSYSLIKGCPALHTLVINKYEYITPTTRGFCAVVRPQLNILVHDTSTEYNVLTMPV